MKDQQKRIFISDLPESATEADIENTFNEFGNVLSVEIKKRKEIVMKNSSFFAYVNIETNDKSLQQCFKYFATTKWFGQNVILQIARESFLERLKREREANEKKDITGQQNTISKKDDIKGIVQESCPVTSKPSAFNGIKTKFRKYKSSESEESGTDSNNDANSVDQVLSNKNKILAKESPDPSRMPVESNKEELTDLIIKSNKGKVLFDRNKLKIESVGNKPILIDKSKEKSKTNQSEANLKRLKSLVNLKKNYQTQKSVIQSALSRIDSFSKNKIKFNDIDSHNAETVNSSSKTYLFDDESEDETNVDFSIKEQFQGKEGQKLLSLQSRYKNDNRFILDSRFVDKNDEDRDVNKEESSLQKEKKMEYEILGKILGKSVNSKNGEETKSQKKAMLRFDPSQPEHSKFEMKKEIQIQKKRKRNDKLEDNLINKKKQEEKEVPEVSKETFYKVTENLKDTLHEKQEFSLLSMFSKNIEKDSEQKQDTETTPKTVASIQLRAESNPFRYDSSDDEEETEPVQNERQIEEKTENINVNNKLNKPNQWSEPFFFKNDDYRLQEGFDFIEKMKAEENTEFSKLRRDLKEIVKAKVRNNQRKQRPFRKKLGGNKRKKMIRMKKALKR